jgi:Family of unknown function (DUF6134)
MEVSTLMDRRQFLANAGSVVLAGPALAGTLPVPSSARIAFKVFRNGTAVGTHELVFRQDGDDLTVLTNFAFVVTIAMIPAYRYSLAATEKWSGGVFQSVESKVNNNGTRLEVRAHKTASGYDVVDINHKNPAKSYPEYTAPPNTLPLTYWNKAMLNGTILNIDTAHSYPPIVSSPGWNKLVTANGGSLVAQRFDVTGKLRLSVWYDQMAQWSGLQFTLRGNWNYEKIV